MKITNTYKVTWMTVEHGAVSKEFKKAKDFQKKLNKYCYGAFCQHYVKVSNGGFMESVTSEFI